MKVLNSDLVTKNFLGQGEIFGVVGHISMTSESRKVALENAMVKYQPVFMICFRTLTIQKFYYIGCKDNVFWVSPSFKTMCNAKGLREFPEMLLESALGNSEDITRMAFLCESRAEKAMYSFLQRKSDAIRSNSKKGKILGCTHSDILESSLVAYGVDFERGHDNPTCYDKRFIIGDADKGTLMVIDAKDNPSSKQPCPYVIYFEKENSELVPVFMTSNINQILTLIETSEQ